VHIRDIDKIASALPEMVAYRQTNYVHLLAGRHKGQQAEIK